MTDPRGPRGYVAARGELVDPSRLVMGEPEHWDGGRMLHLGKDCPNDATCPVWKSFNANPHVAHLVGHGDEEKIEPKPVYGLECADCGRIEMSIEDAAEHEFVESTEDEPHGGWDTVRLS